MDTHEMTIDEVSDAVENKVNIMGNSEMMKTLVSNLSSMHRTLVQSFVGKFIIPYVRTMAMNYKNGYYDGRNESACEMCNVMWEGLKAKYDWMKDEEDFNLPLI